MSERSAVVPLEELIDRGVYDPKRPDAERILTLVNVAWDLGASVDEIVEARDNLAGLNTQLRLRSGTSRYTLAEAASKAGMTLEEAARISIAAGFPDAGPDARTLDDGTVELFQMFHAAKAFFGEEQMEQLTRVLGAATARIAEAFVSAFMTSVGTQTAEGKTFGDEEINQANEAVFALLPTAVRSIELMLQRHLVMRSRMEMPTAADWEGVDTLDRAFGFCDVVGYTKLSGQISATELSLLLREFENAAADLITQHKGMVVKTIGDEVMFVAGDAATACDIALALVEAFDAHPTVPAVRIGLSAGRVIMREGDYYGPIVNLAARIVKLAPEGAVIAPASFRELPGYAYEDAGSPELKGFDEPVRVVLVRR